MCIDREICIYRSLEFLIGGIMSDLKNLIRIKLVCIFYHMHYLHIEEAMHFLAL
jgi:hypothetical protein